MLQIIQNLLQKIWVRVILLALHSVALLLFSWYWLNRTGLSPDEKQLVKWSMAAKNLIIPYLRGDEPNGFDTKEYLFIDVANDIDLIPNPDGFYGKQDITNRKLLLDFFRILNKHQQSYKFAICDIRFENPSPDTQTDSLLQMTLYSTKNTIFPSHLNSEGNNYDTQLFPKLNFGLADYTNLADEFYKWKLIINDTLKTLPLLVYEKLHNKKMQKNFLGLYTVDGNLSFNAMIPDLRLREINPKQYQLYSLEEFVMDIAPKTSADSLKKFYFKDKIVVIGALTGGRDMHRSFIGNITGPLIMLNVYNGLVARNNIVPPSWIILMFLAYTFVFYWVFFPPSITKPQWLVRLRKNRSVQVLDFLIIFSLISLLSFFVFDIFLNVLIITIYIKGIQFVRKLTVVKKLEKELEQAYEELKKEHAESEKLLLNILPAEVANELKTQGYTTVRHYLDCSILFADVKGFSTLASKVTPQELIKELDTTFGKFDDYAVANRLERIKTIGDCYMCVGGVPQKNQTHAFDIVLASLAIQHWMNDEYQRRNGNFWQVRLGIHTGELVAGVIGKTKFAYDVWGNAVNTASRMESGGEVGKVNITETTYYRIKDVFDCTPRGKIEAKNIGLIETFFVDRIKPEFSADERGSLPNEQFWQKVAQINQAL